MVCRVAHSFVRFGSFQLPASRSGGDLPLVRLLADYVIRRHFPHLQGCPACIGSCRKSSPCGLCLGPVNEWGRSLTCRLYICRMYAASCTLSLCRLPDTCFNRKMLNAIRP